VLGQGDFVHGSSNQGGAVGQNTLSGPTAAAFDSAGNMWVPDSNNNRVLEFLPPFINNMNASLVLGQVDFSHGSSNQGGASPTAATLNSPHQVAFDSSGRLLVTDSSNNRTLVFVPPFVNGMSATLVLGQGTLTSSAAATTAAGQQFPTGVIIAP
jgi:secreted PhoX family phosphatase